jgi:hypothetical protein
MPSKKKKVAAKTTLRFNDLKPKKNPKGGWSGSDGDEASKITDTSLKIK